MNKKSKSIREILSLILLYLLWLVGVLPVTVYGFRFIQESLDLKLNNFFIGILLAPISYLLISIIYLFITKRKFSIKFFELDKFKISYIKSIIYVPILFLINFLVNLIVFSFFDVTEYTKADNVTGLMSVPFVFSLLLGGILIPYIEEIVFRKAIREVMPNTPSLIYYFISGLIFMSLHVQNINNPPQMLSILFSTFIVGMFLSFIYDKKKTIWEVFFIHSSYNSIVLIIQLVSSMIK